MGQFTFVSYTGNDAGRVLVAMLNESDDELVEVETERETVRRVQTGFMPNPEPDNEPDPEPEIDDEPSDSKLRP